MVSRRGSRETSTPADPPAGTVTVPGSDSAGADVPCTSVRLADSRRVTALVPLFVQVRCLVNAVAAPCGIDPNAASVQLTAGRAAQLEAEVQSALSRDLERTALRALKKAEADAS